MGSTGRSLFPCRVGALAVLCCFCCVLLPRTVSGLLGYYAPPRLIAIGDLHGDLTNAKEILKFGQIIDCEGRWIAGRDTVVQMGDVVDRGPHGHEIIDFFADLRDDAKRNGGELVQLLGNHELMNMQGDVKFVNAKTATAFGGMERLKAAFDPVEGMYGAHLVKNCDAAAIRNRTLFVHAGLLPEFADLGVAEINRRVRNALLAKNFTEPLLMNDGPLWTRQIIYPAQAGNCTNLEASLKILSEYEVRHGRSAVDQMVIGHTIMQDGAVHQLCNGKLFAIDIAISQYMMGGGHLGLLELRYDFQHRTDRVFPYIQYPSQPLRQHALPPVLYPRRIPLPPFDVKDAKGVQGAALTIRSSGDSLTTGELVVLCVAFLVVAGVVLVQRMRAGGKHGHTVLGRLFSGTLISGMRRKTNDHAS